MGLQLNLATRSQVRNLGVGETFKPARSRPAPKAMKGRNRLDVSRHILTRARRDKQLNNLVLRSRTTKLRFPHPVGPIGFLVDTGHANCPT